MKLEKIARYPVVTYSIFSQLFHVRISWYDYLGMGWIFDSVSNTISTSMNYMRNVFEIKVEQCTQRLLFPFIIILHNMEWIWILMREKQCAKTGKCRQRRLNMAQWLCLCFLAEKDGKYVWNVWQRCSIIEEASALQREEISTEKLKL